MAAMRLAVFETEQDFDYWKLWFAIQGVTEDIWIGAQFSKSRSAWWWDVGFPVTLTFIDSVSLNTAGVKDGACMAIYQNEYLKELSCSQTRGFLCQESYNINVATQALPDTEDTTEATTAVQYEYTSQDMTSIDTTEVPSREGITQGSTEPSRLAIPGEEDLCRCGCTGNATNTPRTQKERQRYLDKREKEIERKLYLDKEILSTNVRRKTSAEDSRQSAQSVGYVGVIMLALTFGSIFVMDVPSLWYNLKGRSSFVKARALKKQPKSRVSHGSREDFCATVGAITLHVSSGQVSHGSRKIPGP
ncbi:hypothetical protein RRG08_055871 [Elysia crispata]|uniref:C-type lectin domain-containing protein n=1 Tax=Elysia crispata TaxID=231223 RepID=A0AAE0ZXJ9_9GAST|nr:hypothetical protein RRG08_055871 [Elysia crispata]